MEFLASAARADFHMLRIVCRAIESTLRIHCLELQQVK